MLKNLVSLISTIFGVLFFFRLFSERRTKEFKFEKEEMKKQKPKKQSQKRKIANLIYKQLNDRQKEILKLLEKREILLPSDIYELHPDVSTRTLRRDMSSLVESGVVRQEGSTRDTKYILVRE